MSNFEEAPGTPRGKKSVETGEENLETVEECDAEMARLENSIKEITGTYESLPQNVRNALDISLKSLQERKLEIEAKKDALKDGEDYEIEMQSQKDRAETLRIISEAQKKKDKEKAQAILDKINGIDTAEDSGDEGMAPGKIRYNKETGGYESIQKAA